MAAKPDMKRVFSSHIERVGFDEESGELHVHFSNGSEGYYHGVDPADARSVLSAPSIGEELHRTVRGSYRFSYVKRGGR
jgi:hypothetical protein